MDDYTSLDATGLAERVASGEVSPTELVETAITALEAVDPQLNAVVHRRFERARAEAASSRLPHGPFRGVPFVVKDLDGTLADEPYTMGCKFMRGFVPAHDAEVIARLKRAGLVVIAKTNCPELGILGVTEPELHGITRNPWNVDHTPAGSSGGTAACVAARVVPMGHGGDGGGSIRLPSSACGLFGLKTTRARVPVGPDFGEGWGGYVQPGVLTRSVRDAARTLDAIAGPAPGDPYCAPPFDGSFAEAAAGRPGKLRVAFTTDSLLGRTMHPDCTAAIEDAARLCESLGHDVVEANPGLANDDLTWAYLVQVAAGVSAEIADMARWTGRTPTADGFEPTTWFLKQVGDVLPARELQWSRDTCHEASRRMAAFHDQHDVLLCAANAYPPARIGELDPKPWELAGLALLRRLPVGPALVKALRDLAGDMMERTANTQPFNQTGQPAMSVPLCWSEAGLPIGVQFVGRFGDEATLLSLAGQLEEARPWADRRPPVCVS